MNMDERIGAEMLCNPYRPPPYAVSLRDNQVFRSNTNSLRGVLLCLVAFYKVHSGGAVEARYLEVGGASIKVERRSDLFNVSSIENNDLIGHCHSLDLVMGHIDHGCF